VGGRTWGFFRRKKGQMYKKPGVPEKDEFVICTVKDIHQHSIFLDLDEYDNKQGMLHTSEISRRLVRTLRVFFKPGRKLVCKVINVSGTHITLSLRRVGAGQERSKQKEWKNEKRADDLLQAFARQNKVSVKTAHEKIASKLLKKYGEMFPVFLEVAKGDTSLLKNIDSKYSKKLIDLIQKRIIIPKAEIKGTLILSSQAPDGVDIIKKAVKVAFDIAKKTKCDLEIKYIGAPKYKLVLRYSEPKGCERVLNTILLAMKKVIGKNGEVEFKRG
jgi:translation initiation factor 2 subunit 1